MIQHTTRLGAVLFPAMLGLAACGGNGQNQVSANDQSAAAGNAARAAAAEMHNQMTDEHEHDDSTDDDSMNDHHHMGSMGGMGANSMQDTAGNTMSNQSMPMEDEGHM